MLTFQDNYWVANTNQEEWLIFKFNVQVEIAGLEARVIDNGGFKKFSFEFYNANNKSWTEVYSGIGPKENHWVEYKFRPIKANRFRLFVFDTYGTGSRKVSIRGVKLGFVKGMK